MSTAINKYIYIMVNRKFDQKIRASYSVTEIVDSVDKLRNELIRSALQMLEVPTGIEITSISDIPSEGTGLGSSSTYTVGLLNALHVYSHRHAGSERLAREACEIEIERCRKPIGKQDQYIAAYGGLQYIQFNPDDTVFVDPIICSPKTKQALQSQLLMLYTGIARSASSILLEQRANTESDSARRRALFNLTKLAQELKEALCRDEVHSFGEILHEGWVLKRNLASQVSNDCIDAWYDRARQHGAIGGKILGAGGGGFLLLSAPQDRHEDIARALPELRPVPIAFEPQGSKIIYVEEGA